MVSNVPEQRVGWDALRPYEREEARQRRSNQESSFRSLDKIFASATQNVNETVNARVIFQVEKIQIFIQQREYFLSM